MNLLHEKIIKLRKKENAVILAHNYQRPEIQDIADFVGDSLGLAQKATKVDAKYIVFAGVDFMAEGAAITNPEKIVLIPDKSAECPMAAQLPAKKLIEAKKKHPEAGVVLYTNTLAETKAEADIICTSANCVEVINHLENKDILFGPDLNMVYYAKKRCNKNIMPVPEDGFCIVHKHLILLEDIQALKEQHPTAIFFAHPECNPEVQDIADYILSTGGMVRKAKELSEREFIIGTEKELCHRLKKENPDKIFYPVKSAVCGSMKKHTLEKVYKSLKEKKHIVKVDKEIADKARKAINRMLEIKRSD